MSTPPLFTDTKGNLYTIPSASPYIIPPVTSGAPIIPTTARNTGNIAAITSGWKGVWDEGTPKSASNVKMNYDSISKICTFGADQINKAGARWSKTVVTKVPDTVLNYCYDLTVQSPDWTQIAELELDINHVTSDGKVYLLCVQAARASKSFEYTLVTVGKAHWHPSNISVDPTTWAPNVDKHIRVFTRRDNNGNVYYTGVELDESYTPFVGASGISSESLGWTKQIILPNFQLDGAKTSGTMVAKVSNLTLYYW